MATIRTAIALYDGVTAPLQAMHKAMNIVLEDTPQGVKWHRI